MKKFALTAVAALLVLALTGCSFTSTVTKTETVTDANGNTTTKTTTTTNNNGNVTTSETVEVIEATEADNRIVATIAFQNETGVEIYGLYFSSAKSDSWGSNIFEEDDPLPDETKRSYPDGFRYAPDDTMMDMKIEDSEGTALEFKGLDMKNAADPQNILIRMTRNEETEGYTAYVE